MRRAADEGASLGRSDDWKERAAAKQCFGERNFHGRALFGAATPLNRNGNRGGFAQSWAFAMSDGLRIYNLFPSLAGTIRDWMVHLPRIAGMGFNAVYINPFHYPGFSGSLYAVKDYYPPEPAIPRQRAGRR